jgi:histidinol dehydrogenase
VIVIQSSSRRVRDIVEPAANRRRDAAFDRRVAAIVDAVRRRGDAALLEYARRFDRLEGSIEVPRAEIEAEARRATPAVRKALKSAAGRIRAVSRRQLPRSWRLRVGPGVMVEQKILPLARVGCYVPGGRYPLPSSLLMTAIPARVAGVGDVIAVCPKPDPSVFAAALIAGVDRFFRIGGAHAVAALAYGTKTVPAVDKIVGPGNRYVAAAKNLVSANCAIDFQAGPTEIVIVAGSGRASWIAADLIAQAEHDPDARAIFITPSRPLAERVARAVEARMPDEGPARESLRRNGAIVVTKTLDEAMMLANRMAPEHLVVDRESLVGDDLCAGAVFVGEYTAQVAGDYAIGSNHVLPTAGAARFHGGLNAADFVRAVSVQRLTRRGLASLAPTIVTLARAEGLEGHAASIEVRLS